MNCPVAFSTIVVFWVAGSNFVSSEAPPAAEIEAFCGRLNEVTAAGGRLKLVQVYTVARRPAEDFVAPLSDAEVDAIVLLVERRTGLAAAAFYGNAEC